jgi:hypothetical protein
MSAIEEGKCIRCDAPIIQPNEWNACSQCIPLLKKSILEAKKNTGPRSPRRIVINARQNTKWLRDKRK